MHGKPLIVVPTELLDDPAMWGRLEEAVDAAVARAVADAFDRALLGEPVKDGAEDHRGEAS